MNKTHQLVKPYLKKFVLKTHPDYFHNDLIKKKTNAASLQKLNNIFQNSDSKDSTIKLEFYLKGQKNSKKTGIFDAQDSEWYKTNSFFQLCQQADIPILQSDIDLVQENITKELNKDKKKYKTLTQEFAEKLYQQHSNLKQKKFEPKDILNNNLVMFDTGVDKFSLATKLSQWLPDLQPERWWGKIPLLVLSSDSVLPEDQSIEGILVIRNNIKFEDLQLYLSKNLP